MSSELSIITPRNIEEAERLSKTLAVSQLLPDALRQRPQDVLAIVLTGAELGLAPMQSIRGIQVIKGKPTLAAETMGALVRRRSDVCEYLTLVESGAEKAAYETKRRGDPKPTIMTFTIQDAIRAGLSGDNWRKYPAAMLRARCLSAICKAVYSDLVLGLYDPDELAPEGAPASVGRDVSAIPKNAAEVKAQLAAKAAWVDAETVETKPVPKEEVLVDAAAGKALWAQAVRMGEEHGISEREVGAKLVEITGKKSKAYITHEAVEKFRRWLADEPVEAQVVDAEMEQAANPL